MRRNRKKPSADGAHQNGGVLTRREVEVTRLLAAGLRNRAIGEKLSITEGTVKVHLHVIYGKLEVDRRLGHAHYARSKGLA